MRSRHVHTSRRTFLKSSTAALALSPLVSLLNLQRAQAQVAVKRAVFVYIPDGCIPDLWHPTGSETSFSLPAMSAPLAAIQDRAVFIDGLSMYAGEGTHEGGIRKVLTGVSPKSLDVFLGEELGGDTPFRSLQLGVGSTFQGELGPSWVGEGQQVTPDDNPLNVYSRVFGGTPEGGDDGGAKLRKQSVLDALVSDVKSLQGKLGQVERAKLEVHLESLRELEGRLAGVASGMGGACDPGAFDTRGFRVNEMDYYPLTYHKEENFKLVGELQMDLLTMALACGSTNVASLTWSHPVSPTKIPELGIQTGNHDVSHYGDRNSSMAQDWVRLKNWWTERFVYLVEKLASTPDGSGSLLDNTLLMLYSELGDSNLHDHARVPFVLAGGAGGALRTGRYLDYRGKNGGENEPHTKLLVSIANMMGVPIESFGYVGHGTGPLAGL